MHRYFADRERLIGAATLDAIRVLNDAVTEAATDQGPAVDAMHRLITALVSVGDRIRFLYGDTNVMHNIPPADQPNDAPIIELIKRGQDKGVFDPELGVSWIQHALVVLVHKGCEQANNGELPRHNVVPMVIRTLERGIRVPS